MASITRAIRVRPGASATQVGGSYGSGATAELVVRVNERAVDGKASEAAVRALAKALGVSQRSVTLETLGSSRTKKVTVDAIEITVEELTSRWAELMSAK